MRHWLGWSYKRVKARIHTVEERVRMHPHKPHATSQPSRFSPAQPNCTTSTATTLGWRFRDSAQVWSDFSKVLQEVALGGGGGGPLAWDSFYECCAIPLTIGPRCRSSLSLCCSNNYCIVTTSQACRHGVTLLSSSCSDSVQSRAHVLQKASGSVSNMHVYTHHRSASSFGTTYVVVCASCKWLPLRQVNTDST